MCDAIEKVLDEPEYNKKTAELQRLAENLKGIDNVVQIIRPYL